MPTTPDHNRSGVEAAMRGDLSTAEQHFLKAYAANPENAGIALNIGRLMQMQNRHQDLIAFFEKNYNVKKKKFLLKKLKENVLITNVISGSTINRFHERRNL